MVSNCLASCLSQTNSKLKIIKHRLGDGAILMVFNALQLLTPIPLQPFI